MSKILGVEELAIKKIMSVSMQPGSADLDPWSARPLSGNSNGDLGLGPNNTQYKWSVTVGEWIRAWVYDLQATFVLDNKIDGDAIPASEDTVWSETKNGSATITTDGTHVSFNSTGANSDGGYCVFTHSQSDKNHFMIGYVTVTSISGAGGNGAIRFQVRTDGRDVCLDPAGIKTSANVAFMNTLSGTPAEIGERISNVTLATEKWVEVYIHQPDGEDGIAICYVDHSLRPVTQTALDVCDTSSSVNYVIGDAAASSSCLLKVRNIKVGRWT